MPSPHLRPLAIFLLPLALLTGACMHGVRKPQSHAEIGREMRVEGELAKSQFGCLMVRTADGQHYSLARELEGSQPGQRVWVEGYVVKTKSCMPGTTLMPQHAGLLPTEVAGTETIAGKGR